MTEICSELPAPRVEGLDTGELGRRIENCTKAVADLLDPLSYKSWAWYLQRAHAGFAMGQPHEAVIEDLFLAARCLHGEHDNHLGRNETKLFLTRRVHPLELALASGHPALTQEIAAGYGLSLPLALEQADPALNAELGALTPFFSLGYCPDSRALLGLGAAVYAGSLSAIARGFADEAALGLNLYAQSREALGTRPPPEAIASRLRRYDTLNHALADLINEDSPALGRRLVQLAEGHEADVRQTAASEAASAAWLDLAAVALLAVATLAGLRVELPDDHHYRGFADVFAAGPRQDALEEAATLPEGFVLPQAPDAPQSQESGDH